MKYENKKSKEMLWNKGEREDQKASTRGGLFVLFC